MSRLALTCLLASIGVARAEEPPDHYYGFRSELASSVEVGPIATDNAACKAFTTPHTVTGDELDNLAHCLAKIAYTTDIVELDAAHGEGYGAFVERTRKDGKVIKVGPVAPTKADANLPTVFGELDTKDFKPSANLIVKDRILDVVLKVCTTETGKLTSARTLVTSGVAAYDKQAVAFIGKRTLPPVKVGDQNIAACTISRVVHPWGSVGGVVGGH